MTGMAVRAEGVLWGRHTDGDVFGELAEVVGMERGLSARRLALIARACDEYEVLAGDFFDADAGLDAALVEGPPGRERWVVLGADGTPPVGEFLAQELAGILGCTVQAARSRIVDALNLRHRHPRLWALVVEDQAVEAWQAIRVATDCVSAGLDLQACLQVDNSLVQSIVLLGWARARRLLRGLIVRADPGLAAHRADQARKSRGVWTSPIIDGQVRLDARLDGGHGVALEAQVARIAGFLVADGDADELSLRRAKALAMLAIPHVAAAFLEDHGHPGDAPVTRIDPDRLRPKATLVVHMHADDITLPSTDGCVPTGAGVARIEGHGPIDLDSLHHLLRGAQVSVRPVVDLNQAPASDAYEVPERLRRHVLARHPVEVAPWSARTASACDLDHTVPFDHHISTGRQQTRADNLGPLGRFAHRAKTHGGYQVTQLEAGIFHWETPAGFAYLVTPHGTHRLGRAHRVPEKPDRRRATVPRPPTPRWEGPRRPPPVTKIPGQEHLGPHAPAPY